MKKRKVDAIILCGGKGMRLRPLTHTIPKPLVKINNKEILKYIIEYLERFNINNIYLAAGYKSQKIKYFIKKNKFKSMIKIIDSGESADILKRIKDCLNEISNDFIVMYGDTLTNIDINNLAKNSLKHNKLATISIWQMPINYGLIEFDKKNLALSFVEKPLLDKWINIGYFYFKYKIKKLIRNSSNWDIFLKKIISLKQLNVFKHKDLHITVNTISELQESEKNIKKFK